MKIRRITESDLMAVFETQLKYHPKEKLSEAKRKVIRRAFRDGYKIADCVRAIVGCHHTPHNLGQNDRGGTKYLGIHISLKPENIDRFIEVGDGVVVATERDTTAEEAEKRRERAEYEKARNLSPEEREAQAEAFRAERRAAGI